MRKRLVSAIVLTAVLPLGAPASAHPGHGSCSGGVSDLSGAGLTNEVASTEGGLGLTDEGGTVGHTLLCEPSP